MWYHGPGLAIERLHDQQQGSSQELQSLLSENAELRAEVQALQQLLEVWQPQACCICQLHASTNTSTSSSRGSSRLPAASAHAAIDRILRQQQVLIAQQQRQLLVLQSELACREQVIMEADAVLAETNRRINSLAAWATTTTQQQGQDTQQQQRLTTALNRPTTGSSTSSGVGMRTAAAAAAQSSKLAASRGGAASVVQQVCGVVLEQCRSLLAWCREADACISRSKAASAAACRGTSLQGSSSSGTVAPGRRAASSSGGGSKQQWQSGGGQGAGGGSGQQQEEVHAVHYIAAGGNAYLQPHTHLTLAGLAAGEGLAALSAAAVQQLMRQLASLAAPLAAFAVQLRSTILPALPWVQASQLGPELLNSCSTLAERTADAAVQLARLCAVLPAASSSFCSNKASSSPPDSLQQGQRSQQQGSGAAAAEPTAAGEDILLGHEDEGLLLEVRAVLLQLPCAGNSTSGRQAAGCRVSNSAAVLGRLQQRLHVLCLKQRVLNEQLSFLAKCSAAQAKLMTALASDVLQELTAAVDAAEPASHQQQRARALQLCSQLQRAAALAQQQQSGANDTSSISMGMLAARSSSSSSAGGGGLNTARTVLMLLESNRQVLDDLPKLLTACSASALKGAATAAVVRALKDFKAALRP